VFAISVVVCPTGGGEESAVACEFGGPAGAGAVTPLGDWVAGGGAIDHPHPACAELCRTAGVEPVGDDTRVGDFDDPGAGGDVELPAAVSAVEIVLKLPGAFEVPGSWSS